MVDKPKVKTRSSETSQLRPRVSGQEWTDELLRRFPGMDVEALQLALRFMNVGRDLSVAFLGWFQQMGLSEARFTVLMMIYRSEWQTGHAIPSNLAQQAGIGRAAMTQLLDGLENEGWIEREVDPEDRRRIAIKLTKTGRTKLADFLPNHYARVDGALNALSSTDRKTLARLLDKIESGAAAIAWGEGDQTLPR